MRLFTVFGFLICSAVTAAQAASDFQPPSDVPTYGIGFRGDGTGLLPKANPPVKWSEQQNVIWKVQRPNWGYACPVPVGNRVLCITEPGHESLWPELTCYDANTGEEVWQAEIVPPQATAQDIEMLRALCEKTKAAYRIMAPIEKAGESRIGRKDPRWGPINKKLAQYDLKCNQFKKGYGLLRMVRETSDKWKNMRKALSRKGIEARTTWWNFGHARIGHAFPTPVSDGEKVYVMTRHWTVACYDIAGGKKVWAVNAYEPGKTSMGRGLLGSPRLYEDLLLTGFVTTGGKDTMICWDKNTGQRKWVVSANSPDRGPLERYKSRHGGSPIVMTVGDTPVVTSGAGAVIRLPDGHVFAKGLPPACGTYAVDDRNDRVFCWGSSDRGSLSWGMQLRMNGRELSVEKLYALRGGGGVSGIFANNSVWRNEVRMNPEDGLPVTFKSDKKRYTKWQEARKNDDWRKARWQMGEHTKRNKSAPDTRHVLLCAGGRVYGLRELEAKWSKRHHGIDATCGIAEVYDANGRKLATNILQEAKWDSETETKWREQGFKPMFSYACQFSIGGNRIYVASNDYLYCIGRPGEPLALHTGCAGPLTDAPAAPKPTRTRNSRPASSVRKAAATRQGEQDEVDRGKVLRDLVAAVKAGKRPMLYLSSMRMRLKVVAAQANGRLQLSMRGNRLPFSFKRLSDREVENLAAALD